MDLVDAHMHLWDTARFTYPWFAGDPRLDRAFLPAHYRQQVSEPASLVFVEAACLPEQGLAEVDWVITQAEASGLPIHAVVAAAHVDDPMTLSAVLDALQQRPLVRGVRRGLYDTPAEQILSAGFRAGLAEVARRDLTFDVSGHWDQLETFAEAAATVPELVVVLDHVGKPPVAAGWDSPQREGWSRGLRALARRENAVLKLSGLIPETPASLDLESAVRPFLAHALEVFGPQRCLLGSDWPMSTSAPGPRGILAWQHLVLHASGLDPAERTAVAAATARATYHLPTPMSTGPARPGPPPTSP